MPGPAAWIAVSLYIALSLLMIPYAGVQDDEALFALPLWERVGPAFEIRVFHHNLPLMLMSYLGTLKTLVYWPLFKLFGSGVWTVRLPVVLAGAATIFLFYQLLSKSLSGPGAGAAAAWGTLLLATDPTFLLTNTFDWGPVALEHLLLTGGCSSALLFARQKFLGHLATSFFLFGLALWNKAVFLWALGGLGAATLLVFYGELRELASRRSLAVAATAFVLGAFPFILYNIRQTGATVGENLHLETGRIGQKWLQLELAASGTSLFGVIAAEDDWPAPKVVHSVPGRVAKWVRERLGQHRETGFVWAFAGFLALVPFWWHSRAARFALVFIVAAWNLMVLTKDAGAAAHHDVLLWPFPILFVAAAMGRMPWRWLTRACGMTLVAMNLLVLNQYLYQFARNGAAGSFTDALFPLKGALEKYRGRHLYVIDWGMMYSMDLASQGKLGLKSAVDPLLKDDPNEIERGQLTRLLSDPDAIFVAHVAGKEAFPGVGARLERFAASLGLRKQVAEIVTDSNGRPVFELVRYQKL